MSSAPEDRIRLIDTDAVPAHIAVIMDGNGRWARQRNLPRIAGHRAGIQSVREILEASVELGVGALTLYAFSTENWKRPPSEVRALMELLREYLDREIDNLDRNDIRFETLGDSSALGPVIRSELEHAVERTADNGGLRFNVALNYSGRDELLRAVNAILTQAKDDPRLLEGVTEEHISRHLYTAGLADPDLLIRTSGE